MTTTITRLDAAIKRAVRIYRIRKASGKPYAVALKRIGYLTNKWTAAREEARASGQL